MVVFNGVSTSQKYIFWESVIHNQPWLAFTVGWSLFLQITDSDQYGYIRWNRFILGHLISKWEWLCGGAELQHTEVAQPWLNCCGFSALSWSFPPAQHGYFRSWKEASVVAGLAGVESCWAAWALLYLSLSGITPGLVLEQPYRNDGI